MGLWDAVKSVASNAVHVVKDVATGHPINAIKDAGKTVMSVAKLPVEAVKFVGNEALDLGKVAVNAVKNQFKMAKDGIGLGIDVLTGNKEAIKNKLIDIGHDMKDTLKNLQRGINNKLLLPLTFIPGVNAVYGGLDAGLNIAGTVADNIPIPSKSGAQGQGPVNLDNAEPSNLMDKQGLASEQFAKYGTTRSTVNAAMADMDFGAGQQAPAARGSRNVMKPD